MVKIVIRLACLSLFALMLSIPAMAQNTKGDKPTNTRETRFKKTQKQRPAKRVSSKRRTTTSLRAYKPRKKSKGGERAGQAVAPIYRSQPGREGTQNTYSQKSIYVNRKSESGKNTEQRSSKRAPRIVQPRSRTQTTRNTYPQSGRFVNYSSTADRKPPRRKRTVYPRSASRSFISRKSVNVWANFSRPRQKKERAYSGDITGRRVRTRNFETKRPAIITRTPPVRSRTESSESRAARGTNRYVSGSATSPRVTQRPVSNRATLARVKRLQSRRAPEGGRKITVVPRSASSPFLKRKSTNVWAHFPRPKRRSERAVTTDIAGKPLRTKNYQTTKPGLLQASPRTARRFGDRPYQGPASGGYKSASRSGRTWRGDVARRRLIDRNSSSDRGFLGKAKPGGYRSASRPGETRPGKSPIAVRAPKSGLGIGGYRGNLRAGRKGFGNQGEGYSGNIKSRRMVKGGGSISGRAWNNRGTPIPARTPGIGAMGIGKYRGNIRGKKGFGDQGEGFAGTIKARRPVKGGGSISGKVWNNNNQPNPARPPGIGGKGVDYSGNIRGGRKTFGDQGEGYSGNIRGGRKTFGDQGEGFSGSIKARRPAKGGGSVSGKLWNNNENPIVVRAPRSEQGIGFSGNLRRGKKVFADQGEGFSGAIKARKPAKGGGSISGKLWNNNESPIQVRAPKSEQGGEFRGNLKLRKGYVKNPNAADEALKKNREKTTYLTDGLHVRVEQRPYGKKLSAAEGSLPGWKPSKESIRASEFTKVIRSYKYVRNGSSADEALKVREPGKAFARATDFQGNIKMKKFDLFGRKDLHPDAQFVKTNKNNVAAEKDVFTNFKLWWARLFKKNETQPGHLKDKGHKPRYDKGEQGLWND
ncbi:MAG TPA: hypothetical protein VGD40_04950 [Chryseosolibacter sp.]